MKKSLNSLREKLDSIDKQLLTLLSNRMTIAQQIGKIKQEKGLLPLDTKRWEKVISSRISFGQQLGLAEQFIEHMWNIIHQESLKQEKIV